MNTRPRRLTVPAAFALFVLAVALAPKAHAEEGSGTLRGLWGALWAWFTPPAVSAAAPRPGAVWLEAGAMIDPHGGTTTPSAATGGTAEREAVADPNG